MSSSRSEFPKMTAEEAAALIPHGACVGFSGFTPAGAAKAVPRALAARARELHARGEPFQIRVLTGASTGRSLDETLAQAEAISWRAPYQSSPTLRKQMNSGKAVFVDMHLSHLPQTVAAGFFGNVDVAVIEATEVTPDGRVYLTTSIGASPTYLAVADRVIIELNRHHTHRTREMADIATLPPPPRRSPIPVYHPMTRIGSPFAVVDPRKIVAIVETDEPGAACETATAAGAFPGPAVQPATESAVMKARPRVRSTPGRNGVSSVAVSEAPRTLGERACSWKLSVTPPPSEASGAVAGSEGPTVEGGNVDSPRNGDSIPMPTRETILCRPPPRLEPDAGSLKMLPQATDHVNA